ncbi:glycosyltransferase family 2 protein [Pedobacter africanus]|uniref:Glycosyltransferase involved in cell wall bisynthesis n=1 Tax=Pedobacter africanus TaxID=151894 RepID=A0A1W2BSB2_9SPHI|nr:glycosyltransferase family 2 protein [Pedobacter africanus]SMC75875.1 Glycosyltransferase involved in cell wall bisynthesis [Pedobacter africanus]
MTSSGPKVSICIVTYNQEKYVEKCIDSVLAQIVNFEYEIIIADDCSTDETKNILSRYSSAHSDKIKFVSHEQNIGPFRNFVFAHTEARGDYVVHLDGDDYTLPGKLQAQADYLDENPDCAIVWHRMNSIDQSSGFMYEDNYVENGIVYKKIDIVDLISNITIGFNSSKMYRRDYEHRDWLDYYELDFPFNVLKVINKKKYAAFVSDAVYGVYRSNIGISFTHNYEIKIKIYKWLLRYYKDKLIDKSQINAKIALLLLSDLKHRQRTVFYGVYAFLSTCMSFKIQSLRLIHSKRINILTKFKKVDKDLYL